MEDNELYYNYLKEAEYYYKLRDIAWGMRFGKIVESVHPWQRLIDVKLYNLLRENPLAVGRRKTIAGIGYLGKIGNESCYVLFYYTYNPEKIVYMGLIMPMGVPHVCIVEGHLLTYFKGATNIYTLMDMLLGSGNLYKIIDAINHDIQIAPYIVPETYGVFESLGGSVARLRSLIEKLEVGEGDPYIVDSYGKRIYESKS